MWVSPLINHSWVPDLCNGLCKKKRFCVLKNPFEMFMVMDSHLKEKNSTEKSDGRQALCATLSWSQRRALWPVWRLHTSKNNCLWQKVELIQFAKFPAWIQSLRSIEMSFFRWSTDQMKKVWERHQTCGSGFRNAGRIYTSVHYLHCHIARPWLERWDGVDAQPHLHAQWRKETHRHKNTI